MTAPALSLRASWTAAWRWVVAGPVDGLPARWAWLADHRLGRAALWSIRLGLEIPSLGLPALTTLAVRERLLDLRVWAGALVPTRTELRLGFRVGAVVFLLGVATAPLWRPLFG